MNDLGQLIAAAATVKPKMGEACNKCGWCCMTEVCSVGKDLGAGETIPCKYLKVANDKGEYLCDLADDDAVLDFALAINMGCDAKTQEEAIFESLTVEQYDEYIQTE